MEMENLYGGIIRTEVVEHRIGNVLKLTVIHYDGTTQVAFLDRDEVNQLYCHLGDLLLASYGRS
jgi:hypothetical protein